MSNEPTATIGRATPRLAPAWLRATFTVLEYTSPGLGGRLAAALWFRLPPAPSVTTRERRTPDGGRAVRVHTRDFVLKGHVFGPDRAPTAYLVHGWGGWWQQLAAHVEPLLAAGYRVVVFDGPNHGDSGPGNYGRSSRIFELADAYSAVVREHGSPALVVAHSAGTMAVLWAAARGTRARAYAFISAAVSVKSMVSWFSEVFGLGPRTSRRLVRLVEQTIGYSLDDFEVVDMLEDVFGGMPPPLLCVHDADDSEAPLGGCRDLVEAWTGADLVVTSDLGHHRILWDTGVVDRVAEFASQGI